MCANSAALMGMEGTAAPTLENAGPCSNGKWRYIMSYYAVILSVVPSVKFDFVI